MVWDPHQKNHKKQVERIQRSAARFVKSNCERTKGTVTTLLNDLKWQSLEERRKAARLTMMYKIVNEEIDIPSDRYLTPVTRLSRHNNSKSFIPHQTRLQSHRHSFFPRTIPEWNAFDLKHLFKLQVSKSSKQLYNYSNQQTPAQAWLLYSSESSQYQS